MSVLKKAKAALSCLLTATLIVPSLVGLGAVSVNAAGSENDGLTYFKAYPKADYETISPDYEVKVNGVSVDTVAYFEYQEGTYRYSYAHLAYEGTAEFEITNKHGAISEYNLSPHSYDIDATVSGSKITFSLEQKDSRYLVLRSTAGGVEYELFVACDPKIDYGLEELKEGNFVDVVEDLGLDNTGATKLTTADGTNAVGPLQDAIDDLSEAGGGTLYFPAGTYSFVYLDARDNVTIFLDEGAYLRGTGDRTDYTWNATGVNGRQGRRLLHLRDAENFSLIGPGTIDGNIIALAYPGKNVAGDPPSGPAPDGFYPTGWEDFRTGIIDGNGASNITIKGVTVKETTGWTFNIENSTNVEITNVKMLNDYDIVHSDGYDLVGCQDVIIDDCLGVCGDDVFCPKASDFGHAMENYLITDGVAYARGGAGCKVGVQSRADTKNIVFDNIDVVQGYRAFCVAHDEGQGAWEDIVFRNIRCEEIHIENTPRGGTGQYATAAFIIWTLGGGQGPVSNVTVENVTIENTKGQKATIVGNSAAGKIDGVTIKNLVMDGITINSSNYQSKINVGSNVENLTIESDKLQLTETYVYEAEVSTNQSGTNASAAAGASGGYIVGNLGNAAWVTIDVFAETAGPREIEVFYCTSGARKLNINVNNSSEDLVYDCNGSSFTVTSEETIKFTANLKQGMNSIKFSNPNGYAPNLDKIEVSMLNVEEKEAVAAVVDAIDALGEDADAAAVTAVIEDYNDLLSIQKVFVANVADLEAAAEGLDVPELDVIDPNPEQEIEKPVVIELNAYVDGVIAGKADKDDRNGGFVGNVGLGADDIAAGKEEGTVTFTVECANDAEYRMDIYYLSMRSSSGVANANVRDFVVTVNEGVESTDEAPINAVEQVLTVTCPEGNSWNNPAQASIISLPENIILGEGENTIKIGNPDGVAPSLCKIVLTKVSDITPAKDPNKYEAEDAYLIGGAQIVTTPTAGEDVSNGAFVGSLGNGNPAVEFTVIADKTGEAYIDIYYITMNDRSIEVSVNGGTAVTISTPGNGSNWNGDVRVVSALVKLNEGENTIHIGNASDWAPNLDYIYVGKITASEGGNQGGNEGGNQGGNEGGNQGGNEGGNEGGNQGGNENPAPTGDAAVYAAALAGIALAGTAVVATKKRRSSK